MNGPSVIGEYSIFDYDFGSVYVEQSDKFVVSFGIGSESVIETYLADYEMKVYISAV